MIRKRQENEIRGWNRCVLLIMANRKLSFTDQEISRLHLGRQWYTVESWLQQKRNLNLSRSLENCICWCFCFCSHSIFTSILTEATSFCSLHSNSLGLQPRAKLNRIITLQYFVWNWVVLKSGDEFLVVLQEALIIPRHRIYVSLEGLWCVSYIMLCNLQAFIYFSSCHSLLALQNLFHHWLIK